MAFWVLFQPVRQSRIKLLSRSIYRRADVTVIHVCLTEFQILSTSQTHLTFIAPVPTRQVMLRYDDIPCRRQYKQAKHHLSFHLRAKQIESLLAAYLRDLSTLHNNQETSGSHSTSTMTVSCNSRSLWPQGTWSSLEGFFCHGEIDLVTSTMIPRYDSKVSSQGTYDDDASGQVVSSVLKQGSRCLVHT